MALMIAWAGIALAAVYVVFAGGGWWGIYSPQLRMITVTVAAIVLAIWAYRAWRDPFWRPRSMLLPGIAATLASLAISSAFSQVPRISVEYVGYALLLAALYLLLVRLFAHGFYGRRIVTLAVMLFGVASIAYGAQVMLGWIHWWSLIGRIDIPPLRPDYGGLTYNNPSAALTMVALLGATVVGALGSGSRRGIAAVLVVGAVIGVVAIASGSRSGWFAIGLTGVIGAIVWLAAARNRAWLLPMTQAVLGRRGPRVVALGLLGALGITVVLLAPSILQRVFEGGEELRGSLYVAALRMFVEFPLVGSGPGTWVILRPAFTEPGEIDFYIPHAHDVYVQALAELGLVGAVAGAVVLLSLVRLLRTATSTGDVRLRWWVWASGLGLLYFGLHQVLDSYANMPAFLLAAAIPIAYVDSVVVERSGAPADRPPSMRRWPTALPRPVTRAASVLLAVAIAGLLLQESPALKQDEAVRAANSGDWTTGRGAALSAAAADPDIGSYLLMAGLVSDRAGDHAAAESYFLRVARTAELPEAWLNAAAQQIALGKADAAMDSIKAGLRLGYQRPAVAMPAGALALQLGDEDVAREAFANAIATIPSLAGDPWWMVEAQRAGLLPSVIEAAIAISTSGGLDSTWEIPLMAGDAQRAVALAPEGDALSRTAIASWQGDREAQDSLFRSCAERPLNSAALLWCARIADRIGNAEAGARYRETAGVIAVSLAKHGAELRVAPSGTKIGQLPGSIADLWATYTYRRPGPWDILVPSLIHLQLE